MPRANRHFLPGYVWHITQRCAGRSFFLRFRRDRRRWCFWLNQVRQRYGLRVLNYIVTSNHVHLLVRDRGRGEISASLQLLSSRVAQEFNNRKGRHGPFWEGRYHATAVETDSHLLRCITYIDLNMVRAGVVDHPGAWPESGYYELRQNCQRYVRTDYADLMQLLSCRNKVELKALREAAIGEELSLGGLERDSNWSNSLAIGTEGFVTRIHEQLGLNPSYRAISTTNEGFILK